MIPAQIVVGPVNFHVYGLVIGLAVIAAAQVAAGVYKKYGGEEKIVWTGFLWALVGGLIGSRLYHVIDGWEYYLRHTGEILAVWNGGLGIWGAVVGGMAGLGLYALTLNNKTTGWQLLDAAAIGTPLGQAIGRWGNWVNQELYGRLTSLPWGITIVNKPGRYHPLFLYESILCLTLFGVMLVLEKRKVFKFGAGGYLGIYLAGYGVIRLLLEPLRIEMWRIMGMPTASIMSIAMMGGGLWLVLRKRSL